MDYHDGFSFGKGKKKSTDNGGGWGDEQRETWRISYI